jgi:hypothetical protein
MTIELNLRHRATRLGGARDIIRDVRYPAIDGIRWYAAFVVFFVHASNVLTSYLEVFPKLDHTAPSSVGLYISEMLHRGGSTV